MASLLFVGPFGLVVGPSVRVGPLTPPPRMCSDDLSPQPAAREPSLLTEISTVLDNNMCGGMFLDEIRSEMVDAFVSVSGEPAPTVVGYGDKPMPTAEIGLEQFSALLLATGDELPPEKVQAMFEAVDDNGDGKIEFVKYFKAVMDEVSSRKKAESGGGGGFLAGLFGR